MAPLAPSKGLLVAGQMRAGLQQRIERVMDVTLGREMDRLERYMTFLASVGSTAPFVGLFGTVWGIMNSFSAIASTKNTSLAVVAPGIAEALFATALGLVAAIPAVIAYNKMSSDLGRYAGRLEAFAGEFGAILSRQLEEKALRRWPARSWAASRARSQPPLGRLVSEINVTPLVDVMLVLLVIFMVTAPLLTAGVESTCRRRRRAPVNEPGRAADRHASTRRRRSSSRKRRCEREALVARLQGDHRQQARAAHLSCAATGASLTAA